MGYDFSADFLDTGGSTPVITDTTVEAQGSQVERLMIGLMHATYTSTTIPADVKGYFLKAWNLEVMTFLFEHGLIQNPPVQDSESFLQSKFAEVIKDDSNANQITGFTSAEDE